MLVTEECIHWPNLLSKLGGYLSLGLKEVLGNLAAEEYLYCQNSSTRYPLRV